MATLSSWLRFTSLWIASIGHPMASSPQLADIDRPSHSRRRAEAADSQNRGRGRQGLGGFMIVRRQARPWRRLARGRGHRVWTPSLMLTLKTFEASPRLIQECVCSRSCAQHQHTSSSAVGAGFLVVQRRQELLHRRLICAPGWGASPPAVAL